MKNMIKKVSLGTLLIVFAFAFTDCKKVSDSSSFLPSPSPSDSVQKTEFTITFVSNGGSDVSPIIAKKGTNLTEPKAPTRDYYVFKGWYSDENLTSKYVFLSMPDRDLTLYAKWEAVRAGKIVFDSCGGSEVDSIFGNQGDSIIMPPDPDRTGYDFAGWFVDASYQTPFTELTFQDEIQTLYAKWTLQSDMVVVTYVINGKNTYDMVLQKGSILPDTFDFLAADLIVENWYRDDQYTTFYDLSSPIDESMTLYGSVYSSGLSFDGSTVVRYQNQSSQVVIPITYQGYTIDTIGSECFYKNLTLNEIDLPTTVHQIEKRAFYGCSYLYEFLSDVSFTSVGSYAFYNCTRLKNAPALDVDAVEEGTFIGCKALTEVTMTDQVQSIGEYAFSNCSNLKDLVLPEQLLTIGNYAFNNCVSLTEVNIPSTVSRIGDGAYLNCPSIQYFSVDNNNVNYKMIDGNLYNYLGNTLILYIQGIKEETSFIVPSRVNTIKKGAFSGNTNLISLDISAAKNVEQGALKGMKALEVLTVDTIGYTDATEGNYNYLAYFFGADSGIENGIQNAYVSDTLQTVIINGTVTAIEDYAFYGIGNLKRIEGLENITSIGSYAFAYTALESFKIEKDVTYIGDNAFAHCDQLSIFTVGRGSLNYSASDGYLYNVDKTKLILAPNALQEISFLSTCRGINRYAFVSSLATSLTIPDHITEMDQFSLYGMERLKTLTIPYIGDGTEENNYMAYLFGTTKSMTSDNKVSFDILSCIPVSLTTICLTGELTKIDSFAFAYFPGLVQVEFPDTVSEIGSYAFYQCVKLASTSLNDHIVTIGEYAYAYCIALKTVTIPGSVENFGHSAFRGCLELTDVVLEEGVREVPESCFIPYIEQNTTTGATVFYSKLANVTLPSTITSVGALSFAYAGSYDGVNSPVTITINQILHSQLSTIGEAAFEGAAISSIELPASLEVIGQEAFALTPLLKSVTLGNATQGSNVTTFGAISFYACEALEEIRIYKNITSAEEVPELVQHTLNNVDYSCFYASKSGFKIFVTEESYSWLTNDPYWASYSSQLVIM